MALHGTYRSSVSLAGPWSFRTATAGPADDPPTASDWADARTVEVPHVWQELPDLRDYTGAAWYRRAVDLEPGPDDQRAFLRFDAADYETTAWVNGTRVGTNRGGHLPFEFEVTDALVDGENTLTVRVVDPEDAAAIPHGKQGAPWYTRVSGIWQPVTLDFRPHAHVTTARVTPDLETDTATVEVDVDAPTLDRVRASVTAELDGTTAATDTVDPTTEAATLAFDDPAYWAPDSPTLYDLDVLLEVDGDPVDRYTDTFGLRSIETTPDGLLLNGDPFAVRGVLDQEFYPGTLYRPFEPGLFEREIETLTDLGFNLVRKHQKPAHPRYVDLADEHGLLLWEEPAFPSVDAPSAREAVERDLERLVERDYNAPSVVAYTLSNRLASAGPLRDDRADEPPPAASWTETDRVSDLADRYAAVRDRDPVRLLCDASGTGHVTTDLNDYHRYFVLPDRAREWTAELDHLTIHRGDNFVEDATADESAPILVSEFGTWGLADLADLLDFYDGPPPWFERDTFDGPERAFTRPGAVRERFADSPASAVFDDVADVAATWQARQFASIKGVLERIRAREDVAGFVLTQLTDVEWEFNGVLTALREEKAFADDLAALNGPVSVHLDPARRVAWRDDPVPVDLTVVNDRPDPLDATVTWTTDAGTGHVDVRVAPNATSTVETALSLSTPGDDPVERTRVTAALDERAATTEPVTFVARDAAVPEETPVVSLHGVSPGPLPADDVTIRHDLDAAVDVAVTSSLTPALEAFAADGGAVLYVPPAGGSATPTDRFTLTQLPRNNSWSSTASLFYHDSPLLADLTPGHRLGWAFEGYYPYAVVTALRPTDRVHVGYLEGWFAAHASPLVTRPHGDGAITACTFPLLDASATEPLPTVLRRRLLAELGA